MARPIVLAHTGPSLVIQKCVDQARLWNPDSEVIVLTDPSNAGLRRCRVEMVSDYPESAAKFESVYQHYTTLGRKLAVAQMSRWMNIYDFVTKNGIGQFFSMDTDILLFCNVTEVAEQFQQYGITCHGRSCSGHVMFVNDPAAFTAYTDLMCAAYTDPDIHMWVKDFYADMQAKGLAGGFNDMTVYYLLKDRNPAMVGNTADVIDGATFDNNMNEPEGYEMRAGMKLIVWKDGRPHGKLLDGGGLIRFNALHMQGRSKDWMWFFDRPRAYGPLLPQRILLRKVIRKLIEKFGAAGR